MLGLKMAKHANYNHPLLGFCLNSKFTINVINIIFIFINMTFDLHLGLC